LLHYISTSLLLSIAEVPLRAKINILCRVHQTLRCTPAMEAGLTDHVWTLEELIALLPKSTVRASHIEQALLAEALKRG